MNKLFLVIVAVLGLAACDENQKYRAGVISEVHPKAVYLVKFPNGDVSEVEESFWDKPYPLGTRVIVDYWLQQPLSIRLDNGSK